MGSLARHFVRDEAGRWTCVSTVEVAGPSGRIQVLAGSRFKVGSPYMGVDLAAWLDQASFQPEEDKTAGRARWRN